MKAKHIAELIGAVPITPDLWDNVKDRDFSAAFATDLMSDVLALVQDRFDETVLITGLASAQTLRTLEMLDMDFAVLVRGKYPPDEILEMAMDMDIMLVATDLTMYDTCGLLYQKGLGGIYGSHSS